MSLGRVMRPWVPGVWNPVKNQNQRVFPDERHLLE